jgi:two-component system, NarL family, response regulator YdfI
MAAILIASPYPAMRAGLRVLLEDSHLTVAGEADTLAACLAWAESAQPQLIVFDLALDDDALTGLWRLRSRCPLLPVLALSDTANGALVLAALQAGARGCLPKTATAAELAEAVQSLAVGGASLHPTAASALLEQLRGADPGAAPTTEPLTPREAEVLRGVAAGLTNKAIALKLAISEHTVKFHLSSAMSKLGAASRAEAVAIAMQSGRLAI